MHILLLVIKIPTQTPDGKFDGLEADRYRTAINNFSVLSSKNKDFELLAENVLQLQLNHALELLSVVIHNLTGLSYNYTILNIEEMKWHEVPKKV